MTMKEKLMELHKELDVNSLGMSKKLGIAENYYSMIFNNKRKPSKKIIEGLVKISGKPSSYWDGTLDEYLKHRELLQMTQKLMKELFKNNLVSEPTDILKEEFQTAIKKTLVADMAHIIEIENREKKEQQN